MGQTIKFTGAELEKFTRDASGGTADFKASYTQSVMKAMGWVDVPEVMTKSGLEGDLAATVATLTPKEPENLKHAKELKISRVSGFNTVRLELEGQRGKGHRTELRFRVAFTDVTGARKLEEYIQTCGKTTLTISYEAAPKQQELVDERQQPLISKEQSRATSEDED